MLRCYLLVSIGSMSIRDGATKHYSLGHKAEPPLASRTRHLSGEQPPNGSISSKDGVIVWWWITWPHQGICEELPQQEEGEAAYPAVLKIEVTFISPDWSPAP